MFSVRHFHVCFYGIWEKAIFIYGCTAGHVVVSIFGAAYILLTGGKICHRRSESVSHPSSSYKLIQLETCQVPVMANAA